MKWTAPLGGLCFSLVLALLAGCEKPAATQGRSSSPAKTQIEAARGVAHWIRDAGEAASRGERDFLERNAANWQVLVGTEEIARARKREPTDPKMGEFTLRQMRDWSILLSAYLQDLDWNAAQTVITLARPNAGRPTSSVTVPVKGDSWTVVEFDCADYGDAWKVFHVRFLSRNEIATLAAQRARRAAQPHPAAQPTATQPAATQP